jgi:uncharacterized membrane protein YhaH (DUF805 family)
MEPSDTYRASATPRFRTLAAPTSAKGKLFSFSGRIPRSTFWGCGIISSLVIGAVMGVALQVGGPGAPIEMRGPAGLYTVGYYPSSLGTSLAGLLFLVLLWIIFALQAKRWHDLGKSAWWILISVNPFVGVVWILIECGCLRGTVGPNQFGEDPTPP